MKLHQVDLKWMSSWPATLVSTILCLLTFLISCLSLYFLPSAVLLTQLQFGIWPIFLNIKVITVAAIGIVAPAVLLIEWDSYRLITKHRTVCVVIGAVGVFCFGFEALWHFLAWFTVYGLEGGSVHIDQVPHLVTLVRPNNSTGVVNWLDIPLVVAVKMNAAYFMVWVSLWMKAHRIAQGSKIPDYDGGAVSKYLGD